MMALQRREPPPLQGRPSYSDADLVVLGRSEIPPHRISRHVRCLGLAEAGAWLAEIDTDTDDGWFFCPRCQVTAEQQLQHGPAAVVAPDGLSYRCVKCSEIGTHERVADAVLRRPDAVRRVAEHLAEEAT